MLQENLGENYTGDIKTDFDNFVLTKVLSSLSEFENEKYKRYNSFLSTKEMEEYSESRRNKAENINGKQINEDTYYLDINHFFDGVTFNKKDGIMKFIIANKIPENTEFFPEQEGWKSLKEPKSMGATILLSLPIGLIMASIVITIADLYGIKSDINLNLSLILALLIVTPIYEILHALIFPESIKSDKVILGFSPKVGAFYAHYEGEISKIRFLMALIMALVVITVIPLVFLCLTGINFPFLIKISALNALCACADVFSFFVVLFQVPKNSLIRNKGFKTYWKLL